jgi:hypothetical protein
VCRPWIKGNGGVEEGRKREGRDEKKKREKVRGGGYRVGERGWGKEKSVDELVDG